MNAKRTLWTIATALALTGWWVAPAGAQAPEPPDSAEVVVDRAEADDSPAADEVDPLVDLAELLEGLTPEQLEALVAEATKARLQVERQQVADEIAHGILYDNEDIRKAQAILTDSPADTQADNIERIGRAFAAVDARLGKVHELFAKPPEGDYAKVVEAAKPLVNAYQTSYLSAARHYLYAEALRRAGKGYDAAEVYAKILTNMPDRISFAAAAARQSAEVYEKLGRGMYAMRMYDHCLRNYGLTLSKADYDAMVKKAEELSAVYRAPLQSVAGRMEHVRTRLDDGDSGEGTQQEEQRIVALLEDLIKTAEENQGGGGQGQGQGQQQGRQARQGDGQGRAGAGTKDRPQGTGQPSSPAQVSALVPGMVQRPRGLSRIRDSDESGDWAELPPRERERIKQIRDKAISGRHRNIISDYRTRLAEEGRP